MIEQALAALPAAVGEVYLRADSALYEHALWCFSISAIGFAISVPASQPLRGRMEGLGEAAWHFEREDAGALRHWAELDYLPDGAVTHKAGVVGGLRYLAIRITKKQGALFADGSEVKHFCVVTNRADPEGGDGGDLLRWHRGKAGTVEHAHDVLTSSGAALPSQKFGANAAWFRNVILYNLLSAFKRLGLPEALPRPAQAASLPGAQHARALASHARERVLRCASRLRPRRPRPLSNPHPRPPGAGLTHHRARHRTETARPPMAEPVGSPPNRAAAPRVPLNSSPPSRANPHHRAHRRQSPQNTAASNPYSGNEGA